MFFRLWQFEFDLFSLEAGTADQVTPFFDFRCDEFAYRLWRLIATGL